MTIVCLGLHLPAYGHSHCRSSTPARAETSSKFRRHTPVNLASCAANTAQFNRILAVSRVTV